MIERVHFRKKQFLHSFDLAFIINFEINRSFCEPIRGRVGNITLKTFTENCVQLGDFLTSDVIKLETDIKMETDEVTNVAEVTQNFDPIILPSAQYLSCTPERYNALFIISSLIGSQKMPIFNDVIKIALLAERNPKALELIANSLDIIQSEQLISMHQSVVSIIKMIVTGQKLTNHNLNMMKVTWMEEAEKFEFLVEKSAKILQISKGSGINSPPNRGNKILSLI